MNRVLDASWQYPTTCCKSDSEPYFCVRVSSMTRIAVRSAYLRIEASTNRCSAVLCTRQFCYNVLCSGSRVSELADRQSQNRSVRSACKIIFKVVRKYAHTAICVMILLGWELLPHAANNSNTAPSDYHLFQSL